MDDLRDYLADNLRALMERRPDLDTQKKISERAQRLVGDDKVMAQSTIQRILKKKVHTSLDIVQLLARVFGVDPLALLQTKKSSLEKWASNFSEEQLIDQWRMLDEPEQQKVMAYISIAVASKQPQTNTPTQEIKLNSITQPSGGQISRSRSIALKPLATTKEDGKDANRAAAGAKRRPAK